MVKFPSSGGKGPFILFEPKLLEKMKIIQMKTTQLIQSNREINSFNITENNITYKLSKLLRFPSSGGTGPVKLLMPKLLIIEKT